MIMVKKKINNNYMYWYYKFWGIDLFLLSKYKKIILLYLTLILLVYFKLIYIIISKYNLFNTF